MTAVIPKISYLSRSVIRVLGCNPGHMTLQGTNTYILGTGKRRVLFDTGEESNPEYLLYLSKVLKENNIKLQSIIISHWHHDHIGGLKNVLQLCQEADINVMKFRRSDGSDELPDLDSHRIQWLDDGEDIVVEGASIKVLHTPGHTTDHVILKLVEENAIFSGDCILGEGTAVFEDLFDYMKSLQIILENEPQIIYPGHGPVIEDPIERIRYYINHRNQRETQIMEVFMQNPDKMFSPMDLVKVIYKDTPPILYQAAAKNVSHHLQKLKRENKVMCEDKKNDVWKLLGSSKL